MSQPFDPGVGAVFSADIAVPEHAREVRFYSRVLNTGDRPLWREDLMNDLGMPIIGLGADGPQYAALPRQWMPHIQVADVGASVERAVELGGRLLMREDEQWAVLLDPNGAAFGIIPVVAIEQDALPDDELLDPARVGRIAWLDLTVADASAARDFYRDVIGWGVRDVEIPDSDVRYADYDMLRHDGAAAAGVCHARGSNVGLPPVWMLYLPVGDLTESLRRVEEEGGSLLRARRNVDGAAAVAAVRDPVGVPFALMQA